VTAVVVDASALVAALTDAGPAGDWVAGALADRHLVAPDLAPVETANVLRRLEHAGRLSTAEASLAHSDLLALGLELWPYSILGSRTWQLRGSLTAYDATYVALAEMLDVPLITLDSRLARAASSVAGVQAPQPPS
jgi:predicted nucleic acid-binding protein